MPLIAWIGLGILGYLVWTSEHHSSPPPDNTGKALPPPEASVALLALAPMFFQSDPPFPGGVGRVSPIVTPWRALSILRKAHDTGYDILYSKNDPTVLFVAMPGMANPQITSDAGILLFAREAWPPEVPS